MKKKLTDAFYQKIEYEYITQVLAKVKVLYRFNNVHQSLGAIQKLSVIQKAP